MMPSSRVSAFDSGSNQTTVSKGETTVQRNRMIRRVKATLLVALAATGSTMFSACGAVDFRQSAVAGTQLFFTGYVTALWNSIVPPAGSLLGEDDAE